MRLFTSFEFEASIDDAHLKPSVLTRSECYRGFRSIRLKKIKYESEVDDAHSQFKSGSSCGCVEFSGQGQIYGHHIDLFPLLHVLYASIRPNVYLRLPSALYNHNDYQYTYDGMPDDHSLAQPPQCMFLTGVPSSG